MDIKESLGKIEQYWQIIRNLHFHIEQEGQISEEEFALLDKYLKVIATKYAALVPKEELKAVAPMEEKAAEIKHEEVKIEAIVVKAEALLPTEPQIIAETIEKEEPLEMPAIEAKPSQIPVELQASAAQDSSISSFLEKMLDDPQAVPAAPMVLETADKVRSNPSFNDKMIASRQDKEDLNTRMKKSMSESISLNEKFEFIRELFGNNPVEYATAISMVDARDDEDRAWSKLEIEYAEKHKWTTKAAAVDKLKAALKRRYS
jgi:hypothetical protein